MAYSYNGKLLSNKKDRTTKNIHFCKDTKEYTQYNSIYV